MEATRSAGSMRRLLLAAMVFLPAIAGGCASSAPGPNAAMLAHTWHSYSWTFDPDTLKPWPDMPQFGLPIPSGGYFGACDDLAPGEDWAYVGYPFCTSADGLHWTVSSSPLFDGLYISGVARGDDGYVMVGGVESTGAAVVLRSSDAINWTRLSDADVEQANLSFNLDGETKQGLTPMGSLVFGSKGFVAVGWHDEWTQAETTPPHAVWHSADGLKWSVVAGAPGGGYGKVFYVAGRYFLTASNIESMPGVKLWYSEDGLTWKRTVTERIEDTEYLVDDIRGNEHLMTAFTRDEEGDSYPFQSADGGVTWHQSGGPNDPCFHELVQLRDTEFSLDEGGTWRKVETAGPPFIFSGGRQVPSCGIRLGDSEFGYTIDETTFDRGLVWIGEPR